jgi:hypothetical protein
MPAGTQLAYTRAMGSCPHCGAKALDEAIRTPQGSTFRCLFCWKLFFRKPPQDRATPSVLET